LNQVKVGRFIAKMRKQQNLTQCEFADTLGISNKTISKWECGNGMPELSLMIAKVKHFLLMYSKQFFQCAVSTFFQGRVSTIFLSW
jgi:transcriptional regulator with XRE-family HTH domain